MTVSDPYIKDLKGWTRKLTECSTFINDNHPDLEPFCYSLERCLEKGVAVKMNAFGVPKDLEAWNWIQNLASLNEGSLYVLSSIVEFVNDNAKVYTSTGKLRLFIRTCLIRKYLHVPIRFVVKRPCLAKKYYDIDSIIGNEILGEIFLSVLLQISRLSFKLNLRNSIFLDETWELPECEQLELVPCKTLGISVCFTRGRALIVRVDEHSVAAEDDKISIGDVLDEINENVINLDNKGKLQRIMRKTLGYPISLHIVKRCSKSLNEIYGPIASMIRTCGFDHLKCLLKNPKTLCEKPIPIKRLHPKAISGGFAVEYCGSISTGRLGDVQQLERAIRQLILSHQINKVSVYFECLEIGVKVILESDKSVIFNQSYMEISSCGRTPNIPNYFAFISGETSCSVAKWFEAHIFYHEKLHEVQLILQSLGQGFQRTHFAV